MSYKGKKVIRILGRIKSGVRIMMLEYSDHTMEILSI